MKNDGTDKRFEDKIIHFSAVLEDVYRDEESKQSNAYPPLKLEEKELTEDFTAMIYALWGFYIGITGERIDIIQFSHIVNQLAVQQLMKDNGVEL